jgi:hypothetical protein
MRRTLSIALALLGVLTADGYPAAANVRDPKILDGHRAGIDTLPFVVAVQGKLGADWRWDPNAQPSTFCSGSLIAPDWVITAAHCIVLMDIPRNPARYVGVKFANSSQQDSIAVDRILVNPGYQSGWLAPGTKHIMGDSPSVSSNDSGTDAALLHLSLSAGHPAVGFARNRQMDQPGRGGVIIAGYGIYDHSGAVSDSLIIASEPLESDSGCDRQRVNYLYGQIAKSRFQLCRVIYKTKSGGGITCSGDSGGPVLTHSNNWMLIGLTSWGTSKTGECDGPSAIDVYTRLAGVARWVNNAIRPGTSGLMQRVSINSLKLLAGNRAKLSFTYNSRNWQLKLTLSRFLPRPWAGLQWLPQIGLGQDIHFTYTPIQHNGHTTVVRSAGWGQWRAGECLVASWQSLDKQDNQTPLQQRSWLVTRVGDKMMPRRSACGLMLG